MTILCCYILKKNVILQCTNISVNITKVVLFWQNKIERTTVSGLHSFNGNRFVLFYKIIATVKTISNFEVKNIKSVTL